MSYARRSVPHRCDKCNGRQTLSRNYKKFVRKKRCKFCGSTWLYVCKDRLRSKNRLKNCDCGGYHFVHRRGSKFCHYNANVERHYVERAEARA